MRRGLRGDDAGAFPVVEAILVAALVLSAILFFTAIQRPTSASQEGGIDLGQTAGDTLQILQQRDFGGATSMEGWVEALRTGDAATAAEVEEFMADVLPSGARYQLRLVNGVAAMPVSPAGGAEATRGARGAEVVLLPDWTDFQHQRITYVMHPGETFPAGDPRLGLVDTGTTFRCMLDPNGSRVLVDLGGDGADDEWIDDDSLTGASSHWKAAPSPTVTWKQTQNQVPTDIPLGTWAAYPNVSSGSCSGTPTYFQVVPPGDGARYVSQASVTTGGVLTSATAGFTADDIGRLVGMAGVQGGTRILSVVSSTQATVQAANVTAAQTNQPAAFGLESPYLPYSLQLVVWFGA